VGGDDVFDVGSSVEELVELEVGVVVGVAGGGMVVLLGEEAGGFQDDAGEVLVAVEELAEVLGCGLGDAVDVLRAGGEVLGHPDGGSAGWG
jgi:hypothetical protein